MSAVVLLLIDERLPERPERRRPEHIRIAYRAAPATATTIGLGVVAATVGGATGALAAMGALCAFFRALDRALPYKQGLREYKQ